METSDITNLLSSSHNHVDTNPAVSNKSLLTANNAQENIKPTKREKLTTKNAVKFLLEGRLKQKVCRYCLNVAHPLSSLDLVLEIGGPSIMYKITIRDMVASFHPFKVAADPNFPNKICNKCLNQTIRSYLFTQQCERSERALRNCFEDMYNKLDKLDPLEPKPKKRGRQKMHPNYNTLYTDHEKVIDYAEPIINIVNLGAEYIDQEEKKVANQFECLKCLLVLPNLVSLANHEKLHPKSMYYHCRYCGKSFTKRNLLKRHRSTVHEDGKLKQLVPTDFKCHVCDVVNEDQNKHIQHIEKHKFQMVMEHLMEKNMDRLCAVCFDKNRKLVGMDNMICLHGGFPEMMGSRTLYNILGSTVPEKSSYKYQELLIPIQARKTCMLKVKSNINKYSQDMVENKYILTPPIIVSKEVFKNDDHNLFIFSFPIKDTLILEETICENIDHFNDEEIVKTVQENLTPNGIELKEYVETKTYKNSAIKTACNKTCWIFKKPCNCKSFNCLGNSNVENPLSNIEDNCGDNVKKQCQYCWMFKNCDKCDFCKTENKLGKDNLRAKSDDIDCEKLSINKGLNSVCVSNESMVLTPKVDNNFKNIDLFAGGDTLSDSILKLETNPSTLNDNKIVNNYDFSKDVEYERIPSIVDFKDEYFTEHDLEKTINANYLTTNEIRQIVQTKKSLSIEKSSNIDVIIEFPDVEKCSVGNSEIKCQYCWLFKNCSKCDHCKKENFETNANTIIKDNTTTNNAEIKLKRKKSNETVASTSQWECTICFTVNRNRELCACCHKGL